MSCGIGLCPEEVTKVLRWLDSDGSKALEAIKAAGGITFAQDLPSAEYDDMPRHAVETGFVDYVLSPEDIAIKIAEVVRDGT
jgi:two-component system CheB/CheR fusion protein